MSVSVTCRTNLDGYAWEEWPRTMACRPTKGDSVQAASGKKLRVVQVTHVERDGAAHLEVELHK